MVIAIVVGKDGINTLLVASQVVLSIVLPFIIFPLIWLTSSKSIMSVKKPRPTQPQPQLAQLPSPHPAPSIPTLTPAASNDEEDKDERPPTVSRDPEASTCESVDFSNSKFVALVGYAIWAVIVVANVYAIVTLILGNAD